MADAPQTSVAINQVMRNVHHRTGALYDFILVAGGMLNAVRIQAGGAELTMMEMRTIMMVVDNPGITATQICRNWNRSRGAVSQILKKLEQKDFVYKKHQESNEKIFQLYPTDRGVEVSHFFIMNDFKDSTNLIRALLETCTEEELRAFYKVLDQYRTILLENPESRWKTIGF